MIENNWKMKIILFLTAQTISLFGSSLVQYAIIWYITLTTSSGLMLTISTVCGFLPQIAISLFAGVWMIVMTVKDDYVIRRGYSGCYVSFSDFLFNRI